MVVAAGARLRIRSCETLKWLFLRVSVPLVFDLFIHWISSTLGPSSPIPCKISCKMKTIYDYFASGLVWSGLDWEG